MLPDPDNAQPIGIVGNQLFVRPVARIHPRPYDCVGSFTVGWWYRPDNPFGRKPRSGTTDGTRDLDPDTVVERRLPPFRRLIGKRPDSSTIQRCLGCSHSSATKFIPSRKGSPA